MSLQGDAFLHLRPAAPEVAVAGVQADPEDPSGERVRILDVVQMGENLDEDFLEEVLGRRPVVGIAEGQVEQAGFETAIDFLHGRRFPGPAPDDQIRQTLLLDARASGPGLPGGNAS